MRVNLFKQLKNENIFEIEKFFEIRYKDIVNDFALIKQLLNNHRIKLDRDVNGFLIHFKLLKYDQLIQPNEISSVCENSLRSLFEVATWLRNFSILNGLASEKIFSKCEERFKEFCDSDLGNTQDTKKFLQEYSKFC
jgi:hypothetical protein